MTPLRKYLTILALSFAGGSIYTLPYLKYIFYDPQLTVMGITNTQSGLLISMYAIGCMLSYIPGGLLADKLSPRKAIFASTSVTALIGLAYAFTFSYKLSLILWLLFAISTAFVFWSALLKAVGMTGGQEEQGFLYGLYYAGNGIAGAIMNSLALKAYSFADSPEQGLFYAVCLLATGIFIAGCCVWLLVPDAIVESKEEEKFHSGQVKELILNPTLWIFSIVVFSGYVIFSNASYLTPYLTNVVGISIEESGYLSIIRNYLFYMLSPIGGLIADRIFKSTSKLFILLFALTSASFLGVLFIPEGTNPTLVGLYSLLPGAFGLMLYGIVFSVIREVGIKPMMVGTAIAIASVIGYSPDFFMSVLFGHFLDTYGNDGYNFIFSFLGAICFMGSVVSAIIYTKSKKLQNA